MKKNETKWLKEDAQAIIDTLFRMLRRLCSLRVFQYNIRFFQWGKVFKNLPYYTPHPHSDLTRNFYLFQIFEGIK